MHLGGKFQDYFMNIYRSFLNNATYFKIVITDNVFSDKFQTICSISQMNFLK